ncbi:uncharacterized protein LOC128555203 [Mercenaria mercenaria]|uniref:uncharacterized protein LOC128555203 n=1 Tax=Mercenaria mercenaria TaxID=6596 RepID=UPI00234E38CE|nr:uncharacterized protein LOC128555203 [Mercenaria mercenaria]
MASQAEPDLEQVRREVFQKLKTDDNADYTRFENDPDALKQAESAIKQTYNELENMMTHANSLDEALAHLSLERQELIKTTFRLQSFKVDIQRQADGSVNLLFESVTGTPLSFVPSIVKLDDKNSTETRVLLYARIVYEIVAMVLNLVGITVTPSSEATKEAIKFITRTLTAYDRIYQDLDKMIAAADEGDMYKVARCIVACLIDLFTIVGTPILALVRIFVQDMSWINIIICVCQALCFLALLFLTGGAAVLVKVISWVLRAAFFINKLTQMNDFKKLM